MTFKERAFILENYAKLTVEEIAKKLGRTEETVRQFIRMNVPNIPSQRDVVSPPPKPPAEVTPVTIRQELRDSRAWQALKDEFTKDELKYFEEAYVKLMSQFKQQGVLASEETQIFLVIKFELLMSRNLKARAKALEDIARLEAMQADFLKGFMGDVSSMEKGDKETALKFEEQLQYSRSAEQSRTTEYVKLQERHDSLMKSLKSTRDQRIKDLESGKKDFLSVLKMFQDDEIRRREGRQMELVSMAGDAEYKRLGQLHEYADGSVDRPILSADTVDLTEDDE